MYYPTGYFSRHYFALYNPTWSGPPTAAPPDPFAMSGVVSFILDRLGRTGCFSEVILGPRLEGVPVNAGAYPLAMLVPGDWTEADDAQSSTRIRSVFFQLVLAIREEDAEVGFRYLDGLITRVQAAIEGSTLGGVCLASRTRLRSARFDGTSVVPDRRVVLSGEFVYARSVVAPDP